MINHIYADLPRNTMVRQFYLPYHPLLRDFQKFEMAHKYFLCRMKNTKLFWGKKPTVTGWRKARNLKNYLVRAKITTKDTKEYKSV